MKNRNSRKGSVIILVIFTVALMSTLVVGILQANTEELQLMQNHVNSTKALYYAHAGLNDAFAQLRQNADWRAGFDDKSFDQGTYSVTVTGDLPDLTVQSAGHTEQGYTVKLRAEISVGSLSPHAIRTNSVERI